MKLLNRDPTPQQPGESNVLIFVVGVVLLALGEVFAVTFMSLRMTTPDHAILTLRSIVEPALFAMLATATYQYHASVNSRQTEWMRVANELARLKGMQDQRTLTQQQSLEIN